MNPRILSAAAGIALFIALPAPATQYAQELPTLGVNTDFHGSRVFPLNNPWNQRVDTADVDPNSATLIASMGLSSPLHPDFGANYNGGPFGIPYEVVDDTTPKVPIVAQYADQSDPGPYPLPPNPPIEGGAASTGDRHVLLIDRDNSTLYEMWNTYPQAHSYQCGSGAIFNLKSNALRPAGWTSADAAGLPIFPGLVRYDEVVGRGVITHAIRFTVQHSRAGYISPARHFASSNASANLPPMGMRIRLKAGFDISSYPAQAQVVLLALKTYGAILADNGSNLFISGAPDARWSDDQLNTLKQVTAADFEVVKMGAVTTG